jgi:hypothetical protein
MFRECGLKMMLVGIPALALVLACENKPSAGSAPTESVAAQPVQRAAGAIMVQTATYGVVCGVPAGNRTELVARECNGKAQCTFTVSNKEGDPKPGCSKDFSVDYRCAPDGPLKNASHPAVQNENYPIDLKCD